METERAVEAVPLKEFHSQTNCAAAGTARVLRPPETTT